MTTKMLLLPSFLALAAASDSKCTSKGGQCQDYTQNKCTAGYEQYLCDGSKLELFFFHLFTPKMLRHSEFQKNWRPLLESLFESRLV